MLSVGCCHLQSRWMEKRGYYKDSCEFLLLLPLHLNTPFLYFLVKLWTFYELYEHYLLLHKHFFNILLLCANVCLLGEALWCIFSDVMESLHMSAFSMNEGGFTLIFYIIFQGQNAAIWNTACVWHNLSIIFAS